MRYIFYFCLAVLLLLAIWQDVTTKKIKNYLSVSGAVTGVLLSLFQPIEGINPGTALLGFAVGLVVGIVCWRMRIYRAGDAKLFSALGTFLGWQGVLSCMLLAVLFGALLGLPFVGYRLLKKKKGLTKLPFAPMIAGACFVTVYLGCVWDWFAIL